MTCELVMYYLNSKSITYVKIYEFNNVVLNPRIEKYKLLKYVLIIHYLLLFWLFKESDILINACKRVNRKTIEWLLTMDINFGVKYESALMYILVKNILY